MQDPSYSFAEDCIAAYEANWDSGRIGKYATYGCKTLRDQAEAFARGIVVENPLSDDCEAGFVDESEPLFEDLPPCPYCGGPSFLREPLLPIAG